MIQSDGACIGAVCCTSVEKKPDYSYLGAAPLCTNPRSTLGQNGGISSLIFSGMSGMFPYLSNERADSVEQKLLTLRGSNQEFIELFTSIIAEEPDGRHAPARSPDACAPAGR